MGSGVFLTGQACSNPKVRGHQPHVPPILGPLTCAHRG